MSEAKVGYCFVRFTYHGTPFNSANTPQQNNARKGKAVTNFNIFECTRHLTTNVMIYGTKRNKP
jgi:hypothetical protein